ncbi:Aerobic-type carbon monoxide dehydrogenase middle subunit CoxM/CutM-like protein [Rubrobacter radiotolerans]|uniref:Aerobic-type carbon monoxide dehydrogenase middle subunit CoxM/CutM-like protein n=1 Tax=Rubrobacter radiotolerans TaxID=42256 RepID=A0A023X607_RUBRA|nr:xanthine dehydrogenase family protein subunit M [Rubrobacter radiotolerans]AHY47907.1 Aerobic-type carbon monoxide dehydrogenase middle subunit CoxM/CutM-like protein [Rubrobacter radiotolerans]MDX5892546.1 xanthine dehydrogenase family protein subunit M [Rubrobacter radiotolerans]SMC07836.1 carbon-monoxide dehydrogenase medium subunit [Rubrobacter radiotolerans DSM 5868]
MIPLKFDYEVAESAEHAIQLLGEHGEEAKIMAGGHSLLPMMKLRLAAPAVIVDVSRIPDLSYIREEGDSIAIGALTRHTEAEHSDLLMEQCGLVAYTASQVGDPQVRHRGTIGGSLAHGDAASDLPTTMLTLDAEFTVAGPNGERTVAARDFFKDYFETDLSPDEILTEIRVPKLGNAGWSYQKFNRRAQDWAVVGVAAVVEGGNGSLGNVRIGLTNMGNVPLRATAAEQALSGASRDSIAEGANAAAEGTSPAGDIAASTEFRQHLARVLTKRAVEEALSR